MNHHHHPLRSHSWKVLFGCGALAVSTWAGCSFLFDDSLEGLPLQGDVIAPDRFPQLGTQPAREVYLMSDPDGLPWVALPEVAQPSLVFPQPPQSETVRLFRLDAAAPLDGRAQKELRSHHNVITSHVVYLIEPPAGQAGDTGMPAEPTLVTAFSPGLTYSAQKFTLPSGAEYLLPSSSDAAFVWWTAKGADRAIYLVRTDGSYLRKLPAPKGASIEQVRMFFDSSGDRLFVQDQDSVLTVYYSKTEQLLELGKQPRVLIFAPGQRVLLSCSDKGVKSLAISTATAMTLDDAPCDPDIFRVQGADLYYKSGTQLRRVAHQGGTAPEVVLAGAEKEVGQLFTLSSQREPLYSLDAPLRFGAGIGDGWLGDWQLMTRGRRPTFSSDGQKVYFLENAARSDGGGELTVGRIAERSLQTLARNVRNFQVLSDGRTLAIANAAFKGPQNRLIVLDEAAQSARWVVDSARDFVRIPGTDDLLVKIVVGQNGFDIRRVPIPLR